MIHVVKEGETVYTIARTYGVSWERILYDNQISPDGRLAVGQALLILRPRIVHQIVDGDTLYSIAWSYQTSVLSLVRNNPWLAEQKILIPGEFLVISYEGMGGKTVTAGGYAYSFIREEVLDQALLYLNQLLVFSYGFTPEGDLIPPADEFLIQRARLYGVDPVLVLTPLSEGRFNNHLVKIVSENAQVQRRLISQLLYTVRVKNYVGVDVDFEYILPEDREGYAAFVDNLTRAMNASGYRVSTALAPKTSADQPGLLYEGIDYRLLGKASNSVFLMTYEWGYTYGPPMPVAPIPSVRKVLDYAVTEIEPSKIVMGIPNYGYDWTLPYVRGTSEAVVLGNMEAVRLAVEKGATIQYDEEAKAPYFFYREYGMEHQVWFEDVRSIQAKFELVKEYGFRGVAYWNLMRPFLPNWLLLNENFFG